MIKTITKVGNSHALIIDRTLMDLAHLSPGAQVNVTVREEGTIIIEPIRKVVDEETFSSAVNEVLSEYDTTLKKLS